MVDKLQWFQAAEEGDLALIQQGINDKIDVNCQDSKRRTAVYLAAAKGHVQLMEYLISQQADLHIADVRAADVLLSISTLIPITSYSANIYPNPAITILTPLTPSLTPLTPP